MLSIQILTIQTATAFHGHESPSQPGNQMLDDLKMHREMVPLFCSPWPPGLTWLCINGAFLSRGSASDWLRWMLLLPSPSVLSICSVVWGTSWVPRSKGWVSEAQPFCACHSLCDSEQHQATRALGEALYKPANSLRWQRCECKGEFSIVPRLQCRSTVLFHRGMWILLEHREWSKWESMQNHHKQSSEDHNRRASKAIYEGYYSASCLCRSLKSAASRRHSVNSGLTPACIATSGRFSKTLVVWVPPPGKVKCLSLCIFYVTEILLCW